MEVKRVLIVVKTYPLPSEKYGELVCTAGMLQDGSFIRLYPIDYRYRPFWQWFRKYQWIEVRAEKNDKDPRKESYRPDVESIRLLGKPLDATKQLRERKEIVLKNPPHSMEELWDLQSQDRTSLGLVKPKEVIDFTAEPDSEEWKPKWQEDIAQLHLFGPERKPLNKVPFKFRYKFRCFDERCKGHSMMIEDWEVGQLYWKQLQRCGNPGDAVRSVRMKFLDEICSS
ncbi:MAG: hypothetical protein IT210_16205, partial [Armatimonadetes bacterium]|nr:hypothetical protein [Armatimonadota bacterium]